MVALEDCAKCNAPGPSFAEQPRPCSPKILFSASNSPPGSHFKPAARGENTTRNFWNPRPSTSPGLVANYPNYSSSSTPPGNPPMPPPSWPMLPEWTSSGGKETSPPTAAPIVTKHPTRKTPDNNPTAQQKLVTPQFSSHTAAIPRPRFP